MVLLKGVKETHSWVTKGGIHKLVYFQYWEGVFWTSLVQVRDVYAYPPLSVILFHYHIIFQPFQIDGLFNSPNIL